MKQDDKKVTGRAIGAKARSEKLTPEQRSEIARKAALAKHRKHLKQYEKVTSRMILVLMLNVMCLMMTKEPR